MRRANQSKEDPTWPMYGSNDVMEYGETQNGENN